MERLGSINNSTTKLVDQAYQRIAKTITTQVTYQGKFGFIKLHGHLIHFILIIDLLYIVQKAEDCFSNYLCQRT